MIYSGEQIERRRYWVRMILRTAALLLGVLIAYDVMQEIGYRFQQTLAGFPQAWDNPWPAVSYDLAPKGVLALALWFGQRVIARLIFPMPTPTCPECAYHFADGTPAKCPECGTRLRDDD